MTCSCHTSSLVHQLVVAKAEAGALLPGVPEYLRGTGLEHRELVLDLLLAKAEDSRVLLNSLRLARAVERIMSIREELEDRERMES